MHSIQLTDTQAGRREHRSRASAKVRHLVDHSSASAAGRHHARGLTLIEVIVVITILSLLMAAVGVYAVGQLITQKRAIAKVEVQNAVDALETYRATTGRYPSTTEGFRALLDARVLKHLPKDPWGTPLGYSLEAGEPLVTSYGADGAPGGEGEDVDVTSRDLEAEPASPPRAADRN